MARNLAIRNGLIFLAAMAAFAWGKAHGVRTAAGLGTTAASSTGVTVSRIALSSPAVKAGDTLTATVFLTGPAQSRSGAVVVYVGVDSDVLAGPREVRVPNGQTSATFKVYTKPSPAAAKLSGTISACTLNPEPYSLLTASVSIGASVTIPGVSHSTTAATILASSR